MIDNFVADVSLLFKACIFCSSGRENVSLSVAALVGNENANLV